MPDMDRRQFLAAAASVAGVSLAGCAGGSADTPTADSTPPPTESPPPVDLEAVDTSADNPDVSLTIAYNATVTDHIPTSSPTLAEAGSKWLAVRMRVVNTGDTARELTGYQYVVAAGGETHEPVATRTEWSLFRADDVSGPAVGPDDSVTGWVIFSVPDSTTNATLRIREDTRESYAVTFEPDGALSATLPDN